MTQGTLAILLCGPLLAGCATTPQRGANADTPGYTGSAIVIGSSSTLAGDAEATYQQQKWGVSPRR
jgi:hypothetical protein